MQNLPVKKEISERRAQASANSGCGLALSFTDATKPGTGVPRQRLIRSAPITPSRSEKSSLTVRLPEFCAWSAVLDSNPAIGQRGEDSIFRTLRGANSRIIRYPPGFTKYPRWSEGEPR
jgi:hypothetical protein